MTTNDSGKLNMGGVSAIKSITEIPPNDWSPSQASYLGTCLTALAHQPRRWYSYQELGQWRANPLSCEKRYRVHARF